MVVVRDVNIDSRGDGGEGSQPVSTTKNISPPYGTPLHHLHLLLPWPLHCRRSTTITIGGDCGRWTTGLRQWAVAAEGASGRCVWWEVQWEVWWEVRWEVRWLVVFNILFWCTLAFVTSAQATSCSRAYTENMGDCLFPYSREILHKTWMRQSFSFHELHRTSRPEKTEKCVLGHICVSQKKEYNTRIGGLTW